jgi:hypothetical protein
MMTKTGLLVLAALFFPKTALANCPVCIVTVGGGLILAEKLGIDTLLVSIWIAGLNTAIAFMIADKIKRPGIWKNGYLWSLIFLATALGYVYWTGQAGMGNNLWGIDKSVLGMSVGTGIFFGAVQIDKYIRSKREGKVLFYYQKVIIPLVGLLLATIVFNFLV